MAVLSADPFSASGAGASACVVASSGRAAPARVGARDASRRHVVAAVVLAVHAGVCGCARSLFGSARALRITVSAFLCLLSVDLCAQSPSAQPYQVEAVFLFNFTQFVSWPADAFADARAPVVICVLGDDPFGSYLDDTLRGEHVDARPLVARRYRRVEDLGACHILYVSHDHAENLEAVLAAVRGRPVLTVGDFESFGRRGGMIRFVVENRRVGVRINVDAARAENLAISTKLLRIAEIVPTREP